MPNGPCHSPFELRLYLYICDDTLDLSLGLTPACVWEWDIFIWNGLQMRVSLRPEGANETLILTINWGHYHPQPLSWICILEFIYIKRVLLTSIIRKKILSIVKLRERERHKVDQGKTRKKMDGGWWISFPWCFTLNLVATTTTFPQVS